MRKRGEGGRFAPEAGTYVDGKGYLTISAGPHRGKRLHRMIAEAMLGRELKPDEDVHHRDKDKLNCDWRNLEVLGHREHGAVSCKQAHYFRTHGVIVTEGEWIAEVESFRAEEMDVSFP